MDMVSKIPSDMKLKLRNRRIVHSETGGRTVAPSEIIERTGKIFQKIGIDKTELINPKYTDNIPIFRINEASQKWKCHRALYQWSKPPSPLNKPPREVFGKGMTVNQSKASAIMEAVERYCGQTFPHNSIIYASYEEVREYAVAPSGFRFPNLIPPKCWGCIARERQCSHDLVDMCYEWIWGLSLTKKEPVLVPAALVHYPYMSRDGISFMFNDTSGLASGNTIEEAILAGIAEVIERDALYNAFNREDAHNMTVLEFKNERKNYVAEFVNKAVPTERIFALLTKNEATLNIPTIVTFICYRIGRKGYIFGGSGTNLDPEVALLRALTEMEQQKVRKKILVEIDKNDLLPSNKTPLEGVISIEQISNRSTLDIKKDIEIYLDELSANHMDVIVVDLTHPDIGIPVVRVIVQGLISYCGIPIKEDSLISIMGAEGELDGLR